MSSLLAANECLTGRPLVMSYYDINRAFAIKAQYQIRLLNKWVVQQGIRLTYCNLLYPEK